MNWITIVLSMVLLPLSAAAWAASPDLVLHNARIYTVNPEQPWAEAVAITGGRIQRVGTAEEVLALSGEKSRVVDMQGAFVMPAFQDAHVHPPMSGVAYLGCQLFDSADIEEVLDRIRRCVKEDPDASMIRGTGWNWDQFTDAVPAHRSVLDAIDSKRPLIFGDADGHTLWINSAALAFAGITRDTPNPAGGEVGRDERTGEPNGLLMEGTAMDLVSSKLPPVSQDVVEEGIRYAQNYLNRMGITAVQDAYVRIIGSGADVSLPAYRALADRGELSLRVAAALNWEAELGLDQVADMKAAREKYSGGRLQVTSVKLWADGILESYTAMLLQAYTDRPNERGLMMIPRQQIMDAAPVLEKEGFQLHVHAIGTATVRYALDAFELAVEANGPRDRRHHIAHVQLVHPDDLKRFAKLGVVANFQPLWAYPDEYVTGINAPQLGAERMQWMYPIASIAGHGTRLAFGSDWYVTTANPMPGIETAITRRDPDGVIRERLGQREGISLEDAIAAYTIGAAYVNFLDDVTGTVEAGKYADLVVLDRNLFDIPVTEISEATVTVTLLEGEEVYGSLDGR